MRTTVLMMMAVALGMAAAGADNAPDLGVNGRPPLGAFGIETLEHVLAADKMGMTLVFTYSATRGKEHLDPTAPTGKALAERGMKVMYNLSSRFTRVRLAREVKPEDTTLATRPEAPGEKDTFPEKGTLVIEGEQIAYSGRTPEAFTGCRRGVNGTKAAPHPSELLLCNSEALKQDILAVKDSPNLWGFWLVDDARPFEGDSLREMARVIRLYDRRPDGKPYGHVIVMGVGGSSAMENFSPGICDALGVYLYPYHKGKLNPAVRPQLAYIMAQARSEQPGIGLIGVPQAFQCPSPSWEKIPSPEEVREDGLAYMEEGAAGLVPFIYRWKGSKGEPQGFSDFTAVQDALAILFNEIRSGKVLPGKPVARRVEWHRHLVGKDARPAKGTVVFDFGNPESLAAVAKQHAAGRIIADAREVDGVRYPARMAVPRFDRADPKSDQWPWVRIPKECLATTDWSGYRYLEQPVFNPMDHTVPLYADVTDITGHYWQHYNIPIPAGVPVLLRLPVAEAALLADVKQVKHWRLWFNAPTEEITLYLGNPVLVPAADTSRPPAKPAAR